MTEPLSIYTKFVTREATLPLDAPFPLTKDELHEFEVWAASVSGRILMSYTNSNTSITQIFGRPLLITDSKPLHPTER